MSERLDLAGLLADPLRAAEVPLEAVPPILTQIAGELAKLAALETALAAHLTNSPIRHPACSVDDDVSDVHEVAKLCRRSVSWVRKRGHTLPGFRQPGGKGTRVAWSRRALEAWAGGMTTPLPNGHMHGACSTL